MAQVRESNVGDVWPADTLVPLPSEQVRAAATVVRNHPRDTPAAREVLAMLGILRPCPRCGAGAIVLGEPKSPHRVHCSGCETEVVVAAQAIVASA